jgi:hypothetical protein
VLLDRFDMLILKINFKKIKNIYYFDVFSSKKYFEKQYLRGKKTLLKMLKRNGHQC